MIVRLFHSGVSNGESPVRYLLGDKDHQGQPRAVKPEVLAGDPQTTIDIINSINRKYKYTSGCLSFRNSEHPTREQMQDRKVQNLDDAVRYMPGITASERTS